MQEPLPISLVIAAFSDDAPVAAAIDSVSRQDYVPAEIIVVDIAACAHTRDVASARGARVIRLPHHAGPSVARNVGIAAAAEPWVALFDADDVWHDGKLHAQWQALRHWPDAAFCFTDHDITYRNGQVVHGAAATDPAYLLATIADRTGDAVRFQRTSLARALVHSMFICQSSVIVKRTLFQDVGGFDERLQLGEESELYFRLIETATAIAVERSFVTHRLQAPPSAERFADEAAIRRLWGDVFERPVPRRLAAVQPISDTLRSNRES